MFLPMNDKLLDKHTISRLINLEYIIDLLFRLSYFFKSSIERDQNPRYQQLKYKTFLRENYKKNRSGSK